MTLARVAGSPQRTTGAPNSHSGLVAGALYFELAHNLGGGTAPVLPTALTSILSGGDGAGRNFNYGARLADGSEGTIQTTSPAGANMADFFIGLTGADTATPWESIATPFTGYGVNQVAGSSTPTKDNCWHFLVYVDTSGSNATITTPPPGGYTLEGGAPISIAGQGTMYVYSKDLGAGSKDVAIGSKTAVWSTALSGLALSFIARSASTGPSVTGVSASSVTEGGTNVHTVTLSGAPSAGSTLSASLVGVTATGGGVDFTDNLASLTYSNGVTYSGGNLVLPAGSYTSFTVSVPTVDDALNEATETYKLAVGGVEAIGSLVDNDPVPGYSISDGVQVGSNMVFTVTLDHASGRTVMIQLDTSNGTKTGGVHYDAVVGQTMSFAPGEVSKQLLVPLH